MRVFLGKVRNFAAKFVIEYSMKRFFQVICGLLMAGWLMTSCLGSSDDNESTLYDDMAVTSFTLGTLNRYLHTTTKAGNDSIYKSTYTGSYYKMNIDQLNHRIYNTDSLPYGTDFTRIVCNVTTKNSGVIYVKSVTSDTLFYCQSGKDSVDFSEPRIFRVFATDGSGCRDYMVTLNVRRQEPGKMQWTQMAAGTELPQTPTAGWEFDFTADGNGLISSNDHWATTITETFDTDTSLLPTANRSFASWHLASGMDYALLVGDNDQQEKAAVVWRKLIDSDQPSSWIYMTLAEDNSYYLPKGQYYWLLPYTGGSVLAVDVSGNIYQSCDQGITWKTNSRLVSPVSSVAAAATDADGGLWLKERETGTVWYGRTTE